MITEMLLYGFVSAFGWWGANHFVIEPVFEKPATMEKEQQQQKCTAWEEVKNPDGTRQELALAKRLHLRTVRARLLR
jgi:hypothetical protein